MIPREPSLRFWVLVQSQGEKEQWTVDDHLGNSAFALECWRNPEGQKEQETYETLEFPFKMSFYITEWDPVILALLSNPGQEYFVFWGLIFLVHLKRALLIQPNWICYYRQKMFLGYATHSSSFSFVTIQITSDICSLLLTFEVQSNNKL